MSVVTRSLGPMRASDPGGYLETVRKRRVRTCGIARTISFVDFIQLEVDFTAPYYSDKPETRPGCKPWTFDMR